ncbi:MAG TPA: hypothetical protein PLZ86_01195, partial [bacterium]|nr:hypothetical protein [bacterium]
MPDDINKAALSSGWAIFLSSVQPDQRADPQLFGNELMRPLSDEFVSWAGTKPDLVGADDSTIARRFASALSLFAERYDLVSRQANGIADGAVAGAWHLYLEREPPPSSAGESPLAGYVASLVDNGREKEAGILSRILFARWEEDSRIDAAIEKLTKEALSGPVPVKISLLGKTEGHKTKLTLDNPGAARALLEDHLGSRVTVSDLIELMDIGSPLMPLKEIVIERFSAAGETPNLTVSGTYAGHAGEDNSTSYKINIRLGPDGRPDISYRTIEIDPVYRGGGMAARSVLALALFARRHGVDGWADIAANMGIFAWSKLGARFNPKHLKKALYLIEELEENGIAPNIDLDDIDPEDIDSIADFW